MRLEAAAMDKWPEQYAIKQIQPSVEMVHMLIDRVIKLEVEVARLRETKADRKGRKPTGGQSPG